MQYGYQPPKSRPRTAWARHLDAVMRDRDWSKSRLFEELYEEMGWGPKSRSAIYPLLTDTEPRPEQERILAAHFGHPDPAPVEVEPAAPDLATALLALAQASQAMTAELAELRRERQAMSIRVGDLEAQVDQLVRAARGSRGTAMPEAPGSVRQ